MLDDLNELKTFRAIMVERSLSRAARSLGVSLGVVSKRLNSLEKRAGVSLFQRTTRALTTTRAGERLNIDVGRALDALAAGEHWLSSRCDEATGLLRVSSPIAFGRRHLAPFVATLSKEFPKISVNLILNDSHLDLVGDAVDVAIRFGYPTDSSVKMRKLADNSRVLVASPGYLDRTGRPSAPAHLEGHSFLRHGKTIKPWRLMGPGGDIVSLAAESRLCVDSGDVIHDWAVAGHGIMLKSEVYVTDDLKHGRLERILPEWSAGEVPIFALYTSSLQLPLKTRVFLDALAGQFSGPSTSVGNPASI